MAIPHFTSGSVRSRERAYNLLLAASLLPRGELSLLDLLLLASCQGDGRWMRALMDCYSRVAVAFYQEQTGRTLDFQENGEARFRLMGVIVSYATGIGRRLLTEIEAASNHWPMGKIQQALLESLPS